jgi:hypothetical protein
MWQARVKVLEDRVETAEGISGELTDRVKALEGIVNELQMSGECSVPTTPEGGPGLARISSRRVFNLSTIRTIWHRKLQHEWFIKTKVEPKCSKFRWPDRIQFK